MKRFAPERTLAAICAAAAAVLICLHQKHFILRLSDPQSFGGILHHRCGLVLLAACTWALLECAALALLSFRSERVAGSFGAATMQS